MAGEETHHLRACGSDLFDGFHYRNACAIEYVFLRKIVFISDLQGGSILKEKSRGVFGCPSEWDFLWDSTCG